MQSTRIPNNRPNLVVHTLRALSKMFELLEKMKRATRIWRNLNDKVTAMVHTVGSMNDALAGSARSFTISFFFLHVGPLLSALKLSSDIELRYGISQPLCKRGLPVAPQTNTTTSANLCLLMTKHQSQQQ